MYKSSNQKTDAINIVLMAFAFLLSRNFPFEVFLFSYIILGPLHYMTEIAWLKDRNFFITSRTWLYFFIAIIFIAIAYNIAQDFIGGSNSNLARLMGIGYPLLLLGSFAFASIIIHDKLPRYSFIFMGIALFLIYLFRFESFIFLLCLFIPTLIHTTIFTGNFMLEGALKNRTSIGLVAFVFFIMCNVAFFILPTHSLPLINPFVQKLFLESNFYSINLNINYLFYGKGESNFVLDSAIGTRIQGFIAFAYLYHYLNWFSKTNVIKWHKISKPILITSIIIWTCSIAIHLIDIKLGITFITLLSTFHVYSEFPLNHRSFINVGSMIWGKVTANT